MDEPFDQGAVNYATHHFCNPLTPATLDRALALAELSPGDRALDLGCANGVLALHLAETYGLDVEAVDLSPAMLAIAKARVGARGAPGRVRLREGDNGAVLGEERTFDLVVATGSWGLVEGRPEPARIFPRLRDSARPGGYVLFGDPFLKQAPPPRSAALLGAVDYQSFAGYVALAEAAGLEPVAALASSDGDYDDFIWRMNANLLTWARANPAHPQAPVQLRRAAMLRTLHLEEGRDTLGFGLYLFRRSGSLG